MKSSKKYTFMVEKYIFMVEKSILLFGDSVTSRKNLSFAINFINKNSKASETFWGLIRLIVKGIRNYLLERRKSMDNGISSYRRFLDGDDKGLAELVRNVLQANYKKAKAS